MKPKIGIISLGCSKNRIDTENMIAVLQNAGYDIVSDIDKANLIIINTCSFIEAAKEEAIDTILSTAKLKTSGSLEKLIVTGCFPERYRHELATELPEVDGWIGVNQYGLIDEIVQRIMGGETVLEFERVKRADRMRVLTTSPHYAYVRIAEGCDLKCTYCAIPMIRGTYRSRDMEDIISECASLISSGVKELILVAQDTSNYGKDIYGEPSLVELLEKLSDLQPAWIRCLYLYPERITERLLDCMQRLPNVVPYLDMPLQHINDHVLRAMERPMTYERICTLLTLIREKQWQKEFTLRTTLLAGFPGESSEQADELVSFVSQGEFEHLGVFAYSREDNTIAYCLPDQVDEHEKRRRADAVMRMQQSVSIQRNKNRVGKNYMVLIDNYDADNQIAYARGEWMAPEVDGVILIHNCTQNDVGSFLPCKITDYSAYDLIGEIIR